MNLSFWFDFCPTNFVIHVQLAQFHFPLNETRKCLMFHKAAGRTNDDRVSFIDLSYFLSGDTINVASRMESTGEGKNNFSSPLTLKVINFLSTASKIHITWEVNDELQLIGGFKTEPRGLIDVKVRQSCAEKLLILSTKFFYFQGKRIDGNLLARMQRNSCVNRQGRYLVR